MNDNVDYAFFMKKKNNKPTLNKLRKNIPSTIATDYFGKCMKN